jgi:hypothetical protein
MSMLLDTLTTGVVIASSGAVLFGATVLADKIIQQFRLDRNTVEIPPQTMGETIAEGAADIAAWSMLGDGEVVAGAEGVGAHVAHAAVEAVVNVLGHH